MVLDNPFSMKDLDTGEDKKVYAVIKTLDKRTKRRILDLMGNFASNRDFTRIGSDITMGTIIETAINQLVEEVRVDGEKVKPKKEGARESLFEALPNLYDEETEDEIDDRLLKLCCEKNPRLGKNQKFAQVFAEYLPDEDEGKDMTPSSTSSATSTSLRAVDPSPGSTPREES